MHTVSRSALLLNTGTVLTPPTGIVLPPPTGIVLTPPTGITRLLLHTMQGPCEILFSMFHQFSLLLDGNYFLSLTFSLNIILHHGSNFQLTLHYTPHRTLTGFTKLLFKTFTELNFLFLQEMKFLLSYNSVLEYISKSSKIQVW